MLQPDRIEVALAAISRFRKSWLQWGSPPSMPLPRRRSGEAHNGEAFTAPAEAMLGHPIEVLSQQEEAHYVSRGPTLNIAEASGLVADLGVAVLKLWRWIMARCGTRQASISVICPTPTKTPSQTRSRKHHGLPRRRGPDLRGWRVVPCAWPRLYRTDRLSAASASWSSYTRR